ncbi:LysR family transcriptional regulator [Microbispora sp. ATCC PTA-5024]|uniref:LysR family transcriptional regulator n=1 Tax=Microbispora sp. ATCC PTA-5024 TaxID=316330 RepID=UPI0003DBAC39|nr:LysR family transcriptional regulator [Microbispora sp. ATCC PTA-5024]ETK35478.1 LysR family transcriptional regulator [Microbispora sp. ATCC PTA-5024]
MHDVTRLAALVAVAEAGSITRAAARLGYTPPALSQQIAKLEREAGTTLVIRHRRGVTLTPAGALLVGHAQRVLDELERARHGLAAVAGLSGGRITIGTFTTAGIHLLPPVLAAFRRAHAGVQVNIREYEPPAGLPAVAAGEADLVLTHTYEHQPAVPLPTGITVEALLVEELVLVAAPGHALTDPAEPLPWRELSGRPLISGSRGLANREALEALFRREGLPAPVVAYETANYGMSCALAGGGMGLALVPRTVAEMSENALSIRRLAPPGLHRTISLVWRTDDRSPALATARALFKSTGRTLPRRAPEEPAP